MDRKRKELLLQLLFEKKKRACERSLYEFLKYFWDTIEPIKFIDNWHIKYICDEVQIVLERLIRGEAKLYDLIVNVPPGTSKSMIITRMAPVWLWIKSPEKKIISASYDIALSIKLAKDSRDIITSSKFQDMFGDMFTFAPDQNQKKDYENTKRGWRNACSVRSGITGRHADLIICDDPLNPKQAASSADLLTANEFFTKTINSRKTDKKIVPLILVMQRLAEDDPTGHLIDKGWNVKHICLPAKITELDNVSPKYLEENYINGLLDPIRLDEPVIKEFIVFQGNREYYGQFLQSPKRVDGGYFKRSWFGFYDSLPETRPSKKVSSWDTAFKKGQHNDYNVCINALQWGQRIFIADMMEKKMEFPELLDNFVENYNNFKPYTNFVEDKASGISLLQTMSKLGVPVKGIKVDTDKDARANAATGYVEAGNIMLPRGAPWVERFLEQVCAFDGEGSTKNDDIVDAFSQLVNELKQTAVVKVESKPLPRRVY